VELFCVCVQYIIFFHFRGRFRSAFRRFRGCCRSCHGFLFNIFVAVTSAKRDAKDKYQKCANDFFHNVLLKIDKIKSAPSTEERTEKCELPLLPHNSQQNQDTLLHSPSGNRIFAKSIIGKRKRA
jgi:hypothetical protein